MKLLVILTFIASSYAFELNCVFEKTGWDDILLGSAFACKVKNLNVTTRQLITKVLPDTNDKTVNALLILEQNCELFPSGVLKFFNSLEGIAVQKSNLKKIVKNDLKGFSNLRSISLFGNKLTVIENELFRYNPKLELVSLFNNQLQQIFPSAFDNLVHLKILYLNSNPCISQDALEPTKLDKLKCELVIKCQVTDEMKEFAEIESEKLTIQEENFRLKGSLDAVSKNLAATKRKFERTREGYERFKHHLHSNSTETCIISNVELKKCEAEKLELWHLIQDLEIVEIKCELTSKSNICKAFDLKVLSPSIEVVNVKSSDKNELKTELLIQSQQTLFLPLNLTNFFSEITKFSVTNSELIEINQEALVGLKNLLEIDFSQNKITEIFELTNLKKLTKLDLSHNRIDTVESSAFSQLPNLVELRLNDNFLVKIMGKLFAMNKNLKALYLENNKITQIASNFAEFLVAIEVLDLSSNDCVDLKYPENSLEELSDDLNSNCNVEIEFECRFMANSEYTCQAENVEIDSKNVKVVAIVGDHELQLTENDVTALEILNQEMEFIPRDLGKFFPNLKKISIKSCGLLEVDDESFENMKKVKELTISYNNLTEFNNEALSNLTDLEVLDFSNNFIANLPETVFQSFIKLRALSFNHNRLEKLQSSMFSSANVIEKFKFGSNLLAKIDPEIIKGLKQVKLIDLTGNKCIDSKYDENVNNIKKVMEIFGEIHFNCFDRILVQK